MVRVEACDQAGAPRTSDLGWWRGEPAGEASGGEAGAEAQGFREGPGGKTRGPAVAALPGGQPRSHVQGLGK